MRKNLLIPEVLTRFHNAESVVDKKRILKENETGGLLYCLRYAFCPGIKFDVNCPEYNGSIRPAGTDFASLQAEARRLYIFTDSYKLVTRERKMEILLQILESVNVTEARLLEQVIKQDIKINGLTADLVEEVFPGLLEYRSPDGKTMAPYISSGTQKENPFVGVTETDPTFGVMAPKEVKPKTIREKKVKAKTESE